MDPLELGTQAAEGAENEAPSNDQVVTDEPDAIEKTAAQEAEMTAQVAVDADGHKIYPSLFDTIPTSFLAIMIGVLIIGGIQWLVRKIFEHEKKEHKALTQFVTSMFAFIVGIWIADKLIAGPSAQLLWENESRDVLNFIKDITLMVFAYYFGTKAQTPQEGSDG